MHEASLAPQPAPSPHVPTVAGDLLPAADARSWIRRGAETGAWRVYTHVVPEGVVQVGQPDSVREELARELAQETVLPLLLLIPVFALLVAWVLGRGLAPLEHTSRSVSDRDAARLDPLPTGDVPRELLFATVEAALHGVDLAPRYAGPQRIERVVRFPSDGRLTAEALTRLPLVVEEGRVVELGQVARVEEGPTPSMIRRKNGQRRLGFNVRVAADLGGTASRVEAAVRGLELPPGTTIGISGKVEEARETQRRLIVASGAALLLVLLLLGAALGTAREVAVVVATLPLAFAGGLYALWLSGETWNASSIVGAIGLLGIAVQNSLVLIVQIRERRSAGRDLHTAVAEASIGRMRPKLMTAGASILGLAPMLFGFHGSELERPLAVVVAGGLVTSTLFTLLVLPALYSLIAGGGPISRDGAAEPGRPPVRPA